MNTGSRSFSRLKDSIKVIRSAEDLIVFFNDLDALKKHGETIYFLKQKMFEISGLNRLDETVLHSMGCEWTHVEFVGMGDFSISIVTPLFMTVKGVPGLLALDNLDAINKSFVEVRTSQYDIHRACQEWLRKLEVFRKKPELVLSGEAAMQLCGQRLAWSVEDMKRVVLRSGNVLAFLELSEQVSLVYHVTSHGLKALNGTGVSDLEWMQWWLRADAKSVSRAALQSRSLLKGAVFSQRHANALVLVRLFIGRFIS